MRVFLDVRPRSVRGWLVCLLLPAALLFEAGTTAAEPRPGGGSAVEGPSQFGRIKQALLAVEAKFAQAKKQGKLVEVKNNSDEYEKLVADSPYPKTAAPDKLTLEQLQAIAKLPPKNNNSGVVTHPAMLPLFRDMALHYTGGKYKNSPIHFRLHTPDKYKKGKKYPLVVWLHGIGERGSDNINQLSHLHHILPWLVGPKKRDFFLLVSQCPHNHSQWEAPERCLTTVLANGDIQCLLEDNPTARDNAPISFTLAMIEAVMKAHPVDPNRITVAGLSSGGRGVWKILERRPDLFAAAVPIVSWQAIPDKALKEKPLLKKIPIWAIYSSDDNGIDTARKEFERMQDNGCRVFKTEFGVCGHRAWTPAMLQGDVFGWLISRAKDGERYYAAEPSPTSPEKIGVFAEVTEGDLAKKPTPAPAKAKKAVKAEQPAAVVAVRKPRAKKAVKARPHLVPGPQPITYTQAPTPYTPPRPPQAAPQVYRYGVSHTPVDRMRAELVSRYIEMGEVDKALAVADKMKSNFDGLCKVLLHVKDPKIQTRLLDYVDRKLDEMERRGVAIPQYRPGPTSPHVFPLPYRPGPPVQKKKEVKKDAKKAALVPIPAGKKSPMEECGKEWTMSTTTHYGLFPSGWEKETDNVPDYVFKETGRQLAARLAKAFEANDLAAMKALCDSFIKLDDIPLSSPWFDTTGGRLKGRIKYTLNNKAKPVVRRLHDMVRIKAESKKEYVELARKALERIEKITNPKEEDKQ